MHYLAHYIIDPSGQLRWYEGLRIHDPQMKALYRQCELAEFLIETFAACGVQTGMA